jgi:hypothetical protein
MPHLITRGLFELAVIQILSPADFYASSGCYRAKRILLDAIIGFDFSWSPVLIVF